MDDVQDWKEEKKLEQGDHKGEPEVTRECGKREAHLENFMIVWKVLFATFNLFQGKGTNL